MPRAALSAFLLAATTLAGCGPEANSLPPPPPHGGTAFPLPEGKGFVEALRQDVPDKPGQSKIVVYFLDAQSKPLSSALTAVSFQQKGRGVAQVALKPTEDTDPSKAGGLASSPFNDPGEIAGMLSATIDGKPVSIAISVR
jgi:hypothetical protein